MLRVLASVEYCEKYVGFDKLDICMIVMGTRLVENIKRWSQINENILYGHY